MEADIRGLRQPDPSLSPAAARLGPAGLGWARLGWAGPLYGRPALAWPVSACCADGLIGWSDPGSLPICGDREIRLAMSDYSGVESDSVI